MSAACPPGRKTPPPSKTKPVPPRDQIAPPSQAPKDSIDPCLLRLLPWLVSRFDLAAGSFRGEGPEHDAAPDLLSAQGRAILEDLGIHPLLPHVVRTKLDRWPRIAPVRLDHAAAASPLAEAARGSLAGSAAVLQATIAPYLSSDFGYTLFPDAGQPGSLSAAYHLLVVVRPSWFAARARPVPKVPPQAIASLNERLMATYAP